MTNAICEVTKFPVAIEFKRRAARRCSCQGCEDYAGAMMCEPAPHSRPVAARTLVAA